MVTNSFVFYPSIVLPNNCNTRLNYLYKSTLNYKVNKINYIQSRLEIFFGVDTLHFETRATSNSRRKTARDDRINRNKKATQQIS